ncbi:LacI family DNA-binding transcriptional regulator [Stackebrandtia nassauensis]|uniref:Transcriptional regulator, LacI family n=1 Tax=Stackebrandtia nassauensis (strain DSM 44728 / CIP 108903 / NRRL B-16338 / NBRC 102104 / LLR-40K-21) TaxID=446470 RepID=D3Q1S2_STANL|nr:LacI family DNA-binding transcriptional regulator [Stackebrandtia nassauensis]ADD39920.1 transcriptional regulator, LacI family [Stackebrandtia nassauensis DSM 44728]
MRSRLKDVAQRAGVSIKTVSNVVHGYQHVRADTRQRVEQAIADLQYRPNLSARSLRAARSGVIALALPEMDAPYFAELARHVVAEAEEHGWTVLIDQTEGSRERERVVTGGIRSELIDGLIFSPLALTAEDLAERTDSTPMVLLGERITGSPPIADHVLVDNVAAAREATEHLLGLGRRRIAAIGAQRTPAGVTARLRLRGYRQALRQADVATDDTLIQGASQYRRAHGAEAMARLLERDDPPDAVFCFNDLLALGALRTLLQRGIRVPEDVALVGFDDIEDGRFSTPTLTTIRPDKARIGALSVDMLAQRLSGDLKGPPRESYVGYELVVRESTAGAEPVA